MTPSELIGRVPDLPSLPEVYFQVDRVLQDPDFSLQELSEVIEREPASPRACCGSPTAPCTVSVATSTPSSGR